MQGSILRMMSNTRKMVWILGLVAAAPICIGLSTRHVALHFSRDEVSQAYKEEFLSPSLETYPMTRKGTHPEGIRWTPEGIRFDPPAGETAFLELDVRRIRAPLGGRAIWTILPGVTRAEAFNRLVIDVSIARSANYTTIVDWDHVFIQETEDGTMVTMVEPGNQYKNAIITNEQHRRRTITITHGKINTCVEIQNSQVCMQPVNTGRNLIALGESRRDREHGGQVVVHTFTLGHFD